MYIHINKYNVYPALCDPVEVASFRALYGRLKLMVRRGFSVSVLGLASRPARKLSSREYDSGLRVEEARFRDSNSGFRN